VRLDEVARASERRNDLDRRIGRGSELLVAHRRDRLDREPPDARHVVVDVVLGDSQLVQVAPHGLRGDAGVAEGGHGRAELALGELAPVLAEDQPVMDVLGWLCAERARQVAVELLVRAVVVAADDVRDPEVDVVDDACELVRGGAVLAQKRDLAEAIAAEPGRSLGVDVLPFALADRALVPLDAEPPEVCANRLLAARNVARRVRVVDPQ
jgi:hypothetical protein